MTAVGSGRRPIASRALIGLFMSSFGALVSFYLLLSVVPLYATAIGASGVGAGLTTGALMLSTVAAELVTPRLIARFGHRLVFAAGLVLLGAPALALPVATSLTEILAVSAVRGLGFAIVVVVGSALVAALVPAERRGEGLGVYGLVVGVPSVVALPLGVWLIDHTGYPPVFIAAAVAALGGLLAVPVLPGRQPGQQAAVGMLAALRTTALLRPSIVFSVTAMAAGAVVTFLPLALSEASGSLPALALLAQATVATLSRWWAGWYGDRHGQAGLLAPAVAAASAGILALVLLPSPAAVIAGMVVFGAGFGITQNASLALMFNRAPASRYGAVSALWNLAFDGGLGLGAAGFGVVSAATGHPAAFAVTAALVLAAVLPARLDHAASERTG